MRVQARLGWWFGTTLEVARGLFAAKGSAGQMNSDQKYSMAIFTPVNISLH
jgi:hypothetical protein